MELNAILIKDNLENQIFDKSSTIENLIKIINII